MFIPHEGPGTWQSFLKRKDNIGLPIMEAKQKYLKEQLFFESYLNTVNTMSPSVASSAAGSGAAGGPLPSKNLGQAVSALANSYRFHNFGNSLSAPGILYTKLDQTVGGTNVFASIVDYGGGNIYTLLIGYNTVEGRWMYMNALAYDYTTVTSEQLQITLNSTSFGGPDASSPTDITNPVGAYESFAPKGGDNNVSAFVPADMDRATAISLYGVN
jgi:hypothetical protein